MKTDNLNKCDIQLADLSQYYGIDAGKYFLVYAPLAGIYFLSDAENVDKIEAAIGRNSPAVDEETAELLTQITDRSEGDFSNSIVEEPSQFTKLSILPNLICNLSCSYCYSAQGRSKMEVSGEALQTMLDYFVDASRMDSRELSIFISGGGEPTLSWKKVKFIVEYARTRAISQGFNLDIFLMTNGTLITEEMIRTLKEQAVNVGISFEILPEIQNSQRGKYEEVSRNIRRMVEYGLPPSISSVITDQNVERMMEMGEVIVRDYPGIRHLNFDPAMSDALFSTGEKLDAFYHRFARNFFVAKKHCGQNKITLDCNIVRKAEKLFPRYCQGKLCLTPEGKISICHSISSPLESAYSEAIYGEVKDGKLHVDKEKFKGFINKDNFLLDACSSCIARWHCAGGCLMYRKNYNPTQFEAVCRFTRQMIGTILLEKLDLSYRESCGQNIEDLIAH